jgi:methylmalonyl-CoA mutase N-terminal domain/subunit
MMEIAVAIATAGKAFNYINAAVNKGHEIQDLATKFGAFFDAKDSILEHEASINNASTISKIFAKGSVEAQALQVTMAKHKAQQME